MRDASDHNSNSDDEMMAFDYVPRAVRHSIAEEKQKHSKKRSTVHEQERDAKVQAYLRRQATLSASSAGEDANTNTAAVAHANISSSGIGVLQDSDMAGSSGNKHVSASNASDSDAKRTATRKNFRHNLYVTRNALMEVNPESKQFTQIQVANSGNRNNNWGVMEVRPGRHQQAEPRQAYMGQRRGSRGGRGRGRGGAQPRRAREEGGTQQQQSPTQRHRY